MTQAQPARIRVLMVCLGNICRSPTAEGVLRHQLRAAGLEQHVEVDSAGTGDWHCGDPPDPRTLRAAAQRSYDLSPLRARQVAARDFDEFDYILAMDRQNLAALQTLCPPPYRKKLRLLLEYGDTGHDEVPDPYYKAGDDFELVLDLVEKACAAFLAELRAVHGLAPR